MNKRVFTKNEFGIFAVAAITGVAILIFVYFQVYVSKGERAFYAGGGDSQEYLTLADNVLAGRGFSIYTDPPYEIGATRTPGYPLIIALIKLVGGERSIFLLILLQITVLGAIGVLSYRLMKKFISIRAAFGLSFLIVLHPLMLFLALTAMSDIFFILFFLLSLHAILLFLGKKEVKYFYAASLLLGVGVLIRPGGLLFYPIYLLFLPYGRWQKKSIALVLGGILLFVAPLLPGSIRNYYAFGTFRLSSADIYSFYYVTVPTIVGIRDGISREEAQKVLHERMLLLPGFTRGRAHDTFVYSHQMETEIKQLILSSPLLFLEATVREIPVFLFRTEWATPLVKWQFVQEPPQHNSFRYAFFSGDIAHAREIFYEKLACGSNCIIPFFMLSLGFLFWIAVFFFAAIGVYALKIWNSTQKRALFLFLFLITAIIFLHPILNNTPNIPERYKLPILPLLLIFAWYGWEKMRVFTQRFTKKRVAVAHLESI
jgi:4-amino-4-deoxy-L-arabinose transferase-like glycosyltransferase